MGSLPNLSIVKGVQQELKPQLLHRIFEEIVEHQPNANKVAFIYDHKSDNNNHNNFNNTYNDEPRKTNYGELNSRANRYARSIVGEVKRQHVKPNPDGDYIVAVCMQPSDALLTTLLSILKAGAAYLPIDPKFPGSRIKHILNEAKPVMVIHDDNIDRTQFNGTLALSLSELEKLSINLSDANLFQNCMIADGQNNLAIVLYTSGSTGVPKGVRLPHAVILNRLQWQWSTFPYANEEQVCVFKTALTFVDSISEIWGPLLNSRMLLIVPKHITIDPERLVDLLEKYQVHRLVLVPTLLHSLLLYLKMNSQKKLLYKLKIWVCSGEPLAKTLALNFFDYFQEGVHALFNFYGSTEVMGDVTYFKCESTQQLSLYENIPIGIPVSNTVIYLLDGDYRPVKNGEIGELFVSGLNLAHGYVNGRDPERFIDNPLAIEMMYSRLYRTGDYGCCLNNNIMYEGRTDSQIKIRGHRVDLSEVEKYLNELSIVDKTVVLCYHVGQIDQAILAFVKLRSDVPLYTELQVEGMLKDKLAEYMLPQVILIEKVPLLVNGKVDRQALLKSYETANNNEGDESIVLDFDYSDIPKHLKHAARDLFETVGGVIGRSTRATLSLHSNFYELGGNSLNSIFTVSLLREKDYNIGISEFIGAKNLGEILDKMTRDQETAMEEDWINACPQLDMETLPLEHQHKDIVIQIIVDSFYGKADLEEWLKPDIYRTDYSDLLHDIWEALVEKDLSFVVRDKFSGNIIGVSLNFDARDEPEVEIRSKLIIVFDFLEYLEGPIRENYLPKGLNKIFHSLMMGTSAALDTRENIACIHFMENESLRLAKGKHFAGIMTTNTSPLTQQLGNNVFEYKTLLNYQVNEYVMKDGSRPFGKAPDSQRAIVHWKEI